MRGDLRKANVLPHLFFLREDGRVDDPLNILGVFRIHPDVDLFMREDDRHSVMYLSQLLSRILGENDDLVLFGV